MADVEKSRTIRAPIAAVWAALTDVDGIEGWMGVGQVQELDLTIGGRFAFFGDSTTGAFTVIDRPRRLAYTWRQAEWPAGWADSRVEWELSPAAEGTTVRLRHSHFPNEAERVSHDEGWDTYFLDPLKSRLESAD